MRISPERQHARSCAVRWSSVLQTSPRANFWRKQMVRHAINRQRKRRSLISLSASNVIVRIATPKRSLPLELLSNFGRITQKHGTTSAPPTINSVATRKRPRPANRRYATNRILSWRATICNTPARWPSFAKASEGILLRAKRPAHPNPAKRLIAKQERIADCGLAQEKNGPLAAQRKFREPWRKPHPKDNAPQDRVARNQSRSGWADRRQQL